MGSVPLGSFLLNADTTQVQVVDVKDLIMLTSFSPLRAAFLILKKRSKYIFHLLMLPVPTTFIIVLPLLKARPQILIVNG